MKIGGNDDISEQKSWENSNESIDTNHFYDDDELVVFRRAFEELSNKTFKD